MRESGSRHLGGRGNLPEQINFVINELMQLQGATNAGDWILINNPCPIIQTSTAFVSFANIARGKMEFAGRNDGTIWACGQRNFTTVLPPPERRAEPDGGVVEALTGYARMWLNWPCACSEALAHDFQLVAKGRGFRPASKTRLPIISEVPSLKLTSRRVEASGVYSHRSGSSVFVCWGHGSCGLTLGMGSGLLLSQLMKGQEPDIDITPFLVASTDTLG